MSRRFEEGDRVRAEKAAGTTIIGTVGAPRSDGEVLVHWDRGGYAAVPPYRLSPANPVKDPDPRPAGHPTPTFRPDTWHRGLSH